VPERQVVVAVGHGELDGHDPTGAERARTARKFYGDVLVLEEVTKPPRWRLAAAPFRGGGFAFHLGVEEPFAPAKKAHPGILTDELECSPQDRSRQLPVRLVDRGSQRRSGDRKPSWDLHRKMFG
jgi:hypothetical protein